MAWINYLLFLGACILLFTESTYGESVDALEGDDVKLTCTLSNPNIMNNGQIYWTQGTKSKVIAIKDQKYHPDYQPHLDEETGTYTLVIPHVTYKRDNGLFECQLQEQGTGNLLHMTAFNLTILIPPSSPRISPEFPKATEDEPFELECSSQGGSPDPQITWYRKGSDQKLKTPLRPGGGKDFPTTSILTITPSKEDDGAEYRCVVWNRALKENEKMETSIILDVNYYPRITIEPANPYRVLAGEKFEMTCDADAKPPVSNIRWKRNGNILKIEPKYQKAYATVEDAGQYVCEATSNLGRPTRDEITVDVLYGPKVSVIQSKDVQEGEDITISCNVSANPPPTTIEWLKNGDETFRQSGPVLRLARVTAQNQGNYVCRAVNMLNPTYGESMELIGNATVAVRIRHAPGKAFILPENPIAIKGEPAFLTCGANPPGWPTPNYRWWKDDNPRVNINSYVNFTIPRASKDDEGTYYCQASNSLGKSIEASVTLKVHRAPEIIEKLQETNIVRIGTPNYKLTCLAQGSPQPSIEWKKDGEVIGTSDGLYKISVEQSAVSSDNVHTVQSTLSFKGNRRIKDNQIGPQDRGIYECLFKNQVRNISSSQKLTIEHMPITIHKLNKVAYDLGENAKLECRMQAHPAPTFSWNFGSTFIQSDSHYYVSDNTLDNDIFSSTLNINGVDDSDYGDYTCKGKNLLGHHKTIIKLQPKGKPEHPTNIKIVESGTTFIELSWEDGFNGGFSNTQHMASAEYANGNLKHDCHTSNPCRINNLNQQTKYFISLRAYNEKGNSEYSEEVMAITGVEAESIPLPEEVFFEEIGHIVSFKQLSSSLQLEGHVEVLQPSNEWVPIPKTVDIKDNLGELELQEPEMKNVRVRFCSVGSNTICGSYAEAQIVKQLPSRVPVALSMEYMIAIILGCIVFVALIILVVICCCCSKRNNKLKNKQAEMDVSHRGVVTQQAPPPPYYTVGLENKGMEGSLDGAMDEHGKAAIYNSQYHGYIQDPPQNIPTNNGIGYIDNSYSNSNNGGSVNSQDSLWQVKGHNQMNQMPPPNDPRVHQYDPMVHGGYGISGYDDYGHYPPSPHEQTQPMPTEEYPNMRINYGANGDPYAAVHKPRKHGYDVSGMPDPYAEHHDPNMQGIPEMQQDVKPQISFDESLESGYSTPNSRNRRIIREIIV